MAKRKAPANDALIEDAKKAQEASMTYGQWQAQKYIRQQQELDRIRRERRKNESKR